MVNNKQNDKKWIPNCKRENSIYKKHPFLSWSITVIAIIVGLYGIYCAWNNGTKTGAYNVSYEDGYKSVYQK